MSDGLAAEIPDALTRDGLILRPYDDGDVPAFVAAVRESAVTVGRWMPWCRADDTEAEALDWFAHCRADRIAGTAHEFGVFDALGSCVGGAGLNAIADSHRICNLGYWVRQSRQREGVASRSVHALLSAAFGPLRLRRVEIVVAVGNIASEGVARKTGAIFEGIARNRVLIGDVSHAASVFSFVPAADA